jgi:mannose-6-phosphate isomerase-like protein (cupin superfamily)
VGFRAIRMDELEWTDRPPEAGDAVRRVAPLTDLAGFQHSRANLWRYEPGARGRRHKDLVQEETFVVVRGTLTMHLGEESPERVEVPAVGLVHVEAGTVLQIANETDEELVLYIYGAPPEQGNAEFFDSVA